MKKICGCNFNFENNRLTIGNALFTRSFDGVSEAVAEAGDAWGLSEEYLRAEAVIEGKKKEFYVWSNLPVLYTPALGIDPLLTISGEHYIIKAVRLNAFTDLTDTLVTEETVHMFSGGIGSVSGNIFFLINPEDGAAVVIISEAPDFAASVLIIKQGAVSLENYGYGTAVGYCRAGECEALCRDYYRRACKCSGLASMSNTWGDRNGWSRMSDGFIRAEIDAAAKLGVDIVQIDDGWQSVSTQDPRIFDENRRRVFIEGFWDLNTGRFPNGIRPLAEYAAERGIKIGMWFAPDSRKSFSQCFDRDIEVLRNAYDNFGARFFKLDMIHIHSKEDCEGFLSLLGQIYAFGKDVPVQLDVTNGKRLGYLCGREYGSIFVENRYTASANSFPHRVLRNLWMLSLYIPSRKFQFEIVNPDLNADKYRIDDPFAPANYDMDYLFAAVMLSNPLFWMEMQFLSENRRRELARLMPVWQAHRGALAACDVRPVGEKPSGRSFTGFFAQNKSGDGGYLLIFREVTKENSFVFWAVTPDLSVKLTLLASNTDVRITPGLGGAEVVMEKERSYAFFEVRG